MSYTDRDVYGMYGKQQRSGADTGPGPALMGANTLIGDNVYNLNDDNLGDIKEIMLDTRSGKVAYAVLSFGGFLGIGKKLFAVPWQALTLDTRKKCFVLDADKEKLKNAPGFDDDDWPDMADPTWISSIDSYYLTKPPH
jgi:sporulation protein YlmC with PRC-barrel domain